ncbi:hypothetical protein BGZ98_002256, partial [Dissophora globulifera]
MDSSATVAPPAPEGYAYAGPVSDFMPLPKAASTTLTTEETTAAAATAEGSESTSSAAASTNASEPVCSVESKTAKDGEEYLIKVVEIPQPAGRYPPQKRVAISHYRNKWYAFIN